MNFPFEVAKYKLIYIFGAPDDAHKGLLKIGETTITTKIPANKLKPNCSELNRAANARIKQYMRTAGVKFKLLHTELAVDNKKHVFRDLDVHRALKKSGVEQGEIGNEWFRVDLKTALRAVEAVKRGKTFIAGLKSKTFREEIILRPEQQAAVNKTVEYFKRGDKFLWNAKMRFGKTLCALAVVREMNFAKTLIVTHRPVVNAGWFDDFQKIFGGDSNFIYARDARDDTLKALKKSKKNFVCFASLQDLRGSDTVGGKFDKNHEVFKLPWDFIIVDEAHEGTKTALGDAVIKKLVKRKSKFLALSGTPFNLLDDFDDDSVYTWDYVMEQRAKADWDKNFPCDSNPYAELPRMNIFTYDLGELSKYFDAEDMSFNFREFFRTDNERFVHEDDVKSFLDLLTTPSDSNYPFSRADFREMFKHTLWIIPGVKEGRALSNLLKSHKIFGENNGFKIVNVAGNGKSDDEPADALKKVQRAIKKYEYTITLSCGKLTAGVTVPEWSAVFMLAGGFKTSAASYMQTIFRVQNPCNKDGVSKQNCYVFDFAPDRALNVIAASVKASTRAGQTTDEQREHLGDLLNFCPVIAVKGSEMKYFDTAAKLLQRIKRVQAERIVNKGFEDPYLYNDTLWNITDEEWEDFEKLDSLAAKSDSSNKAGIVVINDTGLTGKKTKRKPASDSDTDEELDKKHRRRLGAIKALNRVSKRIPMLIYGADVSFDEQITVEKFLDLVDDASWEEFMPKNVTKKFFSKFIRRYDIENFINAGYKVRERAKKADDLTPTERVNEIAALFATFKNPDKETVLTPWRVVKLHIDSVFDEKFFTPDKKILEINSKTGLYPLYVAYKIYRARLGEVDENSLPLDECRRLWDKSVAENVFVICKTPMAETITYRTLIGYRQGNVNAECFKDLISTLKNKPTQFVEDVTNKNFWSKGVGKMFFDAVVGNPPYQVETDSDSTRMLPVYNLFLDTAFKLADRVSLIHPARFLFNAGFTPKEWNRKMLNDEHFKIIRYEKVSGKFFPNTDIKGGIAITLRDANQNFGAIDTFTEFDELNSILKKVVLNNKEFKPLSEIIRGQMTYRLSAQAYEDFPDLLERVSERSDTALRTNAFDIMPDVFLKEEPADGHKYLKILGRVNNQRVYRYVRREYMIDIAELHKYKVFVPASNGSGALGEVVSTPLVGCTQTFITVGAFDTRAEAEACIAYIKSKFCRILLGILKVTQHNPPQTWAKVPLQDFTSASDIDWSLSIPEIDKKLCDKYGLSDSEREFIERHVKDMT